MRSNIMIVIACLYISTSLFSQDILESSLNSAIKDNCISEYYRFLQQLEDANEKERYHFLIEEGGIDSVLFLQKQIFSKAPTDSIFIAHLWQEELLIIFTEYVEILEESFSIYFVENLEISVSTLERIGDQNIVLRIVECVAFKSSSVEKVLTYFEKKNRANDEIYQLFKNMKNPGQTGDE
jgi:hypothetical protein